MSDEPPSAPDSTAPQPLPYRRRADVRESTTVDRQSGEVRHFLKTAAGELFILNEQDYFIWNALDGTKSFAELEVEFRARFRISFTQQDLAGFVNDLSSLGLMENLSDDDALAAEDRWEDSAGSTLAQDSAWPALKSNHL